MSHPSAASNIWVRRVAFTATAVMVVWVFAGWIIDKGWTLEGLMLAAMSGALQALAWNASAQMRRAGEAGVKDAREFWRWTLIVCASWTAFSAHHAFATITGARVGAPTDLGGVLALIHDGAALVVLTAWAFIEPLLGWAIEKTERPPAAGAVQPASKRGRLSVVGGAAAALAATLTPLGTPPTGDIFVQTTSTGQPTPRERALALYVSGERNAAVAARAIGAPPSSVRRWFAWARQSSLAN